MYTASHRSWKRLGLAGVLVSALSALLLPPVSGSAAAGTRSALYEQNNPLEHERHGHLVDGLENAQAADDFLVPAGSSWHIGTVKTTGLDQLLASVKVTIYSDSSH